MTKLVFISSAGGLLGPGPGSLQPVVSGHDPVADTGTSLYPGYTALSIFTETSSNSDVERGIRLQIHT